jgi:hypothetical protein
MSSSGTLSGGGIKAKLTEKHQHCLSGSKWHDKLTVGSPGSMTSCEDPSDKTALKLQVSARR